jgi:glycosyltransferase involved in cell wall biosynthesis
MRILFFTDTLGFGGKERRLLELIKYLKQNTNHTLALVLTENEIYYEYVHEIGIPIKTIERKFSKIDPLPLFKFYKYCRTFKPDIIHAWGVMTTFYAIPAKLLCRTPLITSMIADVQGITEIFSIKSAFFKIDYFFSDLILSNSKAGITAYKANSQKSKVIRNGVHLERFQQKFNTEETRKDLGVKTNYMIVMVGSFWIYKDYDLFVDVVKEINTIRQDVTFVAVGDGINFNRIQQRINDEEVGNIVLTGRRKDVERIISASDIGLLCTYSEGISNAIIEYMALGKPVIATDIEGGSKEIITEGETGYCTRRSVDEIIPLINALLDNSTLRQSMGIKGKDRIASHFSINKMGNDFENVYKRVLESYI